MSIAMPAEPPAAGFWRHRGLILVAAGGAVTEAGLLTLVAPAARPLAPQVTAVPSLAAYHDVRWLFVDTQSWLWFFGLVAAVLSARSVLDATLLRLAWPRDLPAPKASRSALHGGLLGDPAVLPLVIKFVSGHQVTVAAHQNGRLRAAAEAIAGAATAWRMPQTTSSCPG